jgi:hypothetical protein
MTVQFIDEDIVHQWKIITEIRGKIISSLRTIAKNPVMAICVIDTNNEISKASQYGGKMPYCCPGWTKFVHWKGNIRLEGSKTYVAPLPANGDEIIKNFYSTMIFMRFIEDNDDNMEGQEKYIQYLQDDLKKGKRGAQYNPPPGATNDPNYEPVYIDPFESYVCQNHKEITHIGKPCLHIAIVKEQERDIDMEKIQTTISNIIRTSFGTTHEIDPLHKWSDQRQTDKQKVQYIQYMLKNADNRYCYDRLQDSGESLVHLVFTKEGKEIQTEIMKLMDYHRKTLWSRGLFLYAQILEETGVRQLEQISKVPIGHNPLLQAIDIVVQFMIDHSLVINLDGIVYEKV